MEGDVKSGENDGREMMAHDDTSEENVGMMI